MWPEVVNQVRGERQWYTVLLDGNELGGIQFGLSSQISRVDSLVGRKNGKKV